MFSPWFLIPENGLVFIEIIHLVLCFQAQGQWPLRQAHIFFNSSFKLCCKLYVSAITPTRHETITLPATWGRKGRLSQSFADTHHHSAEKQEALFSPRAETSSGNQSRCPSHAALGHENSYGWNWKGCGKNGTPFAGDTQKHEAHGCSLFPPHYSASAVDPLSFASLCAGPPQRFPIFLRQMMSCKPTLNGPCAAHLFLSPGRVHGACLQQD